MQRRRPGTSGLEVSAIGCGMGLERVYVRTFSPRFTPEARDASVPMVDPTGADPCEIAQAAGEIEVKGRGPRRCVEALLPVDLAARPHARVCPASSSTNRVPVATVEVADDGRLGPGRIGHSGPVAGTQHPSAAKGTVKGIRVADIVPTVIGRRVRAWAAGDQRWRASSARTPTAATGRTTTMQMKHSILGLCLVVMSALPAHAQPGPGPAPETSATAAEQEIITLSKDKWRWMAERNVEALDKLFAPEAIFVHMGGTMSKSQELEVIKNGAIQYKDAQIQEVSVRFVGGTAILLNRIRLVAVVGGNEVVNPFSVTEVYVKVDGAWKLGSLSFTRLLTPQ